MLYLNLCYNERVYTGTALFFSFNEDDRPSCWHQLIDLSNLFLLYEIIALSDKQYTVHKFTNFCGNFSFVNSIKIHNEP